MKKGTLYTLAFLLLTVLFVAGCKKDFTLKKLNTLTDSAAHHITVSTLTTGYYNLVAPGENGSVYILRGYADTIYKADSAGNKTVFYTPPAPTLADTAVNMLTALTTDSSGNVYTLSFSKLSAKIIKISPAGPATTYIDGLVSYKDAGGIINIKIDNAGTIYFTNYNGIYKAVPGGAISQISTEQTASIAIDDAGNLIIAHDNTVGKITPGGTETRIAGTGAYGSTDGPDATATFNIIHEIACDNKGNIFVSEVKNGDTNQIRVITNANKVYTLISSLTGHVDGPISTAKIGTPSFLVTDAASNLYFSEGNNDNSASNDIRKITFK